jgi:hypothetical protein
MPVVQLKVYNTMREPETCPECARWDGVELPADDDSLQIPHPGCTSPRGCECYWTWVGRVVGDGTDVPQAPSKRLCT